MPAYEADGFAPPAPVARVAVLNPETGAAQAGVPMLIDTGADVTLIPEAVASGLGLEVLEGRSYELIGFGGRPLIAPVVHARMIFCGRGFLGKFLLTTEASGILGRNILNALALVMNGPKLEWEELHR